MSVEDLQKNTSPEPTKLSDNENAVKLLLDHPYMQLAIGVVVVLMLVFLALKAGFSLWLMNKLGYGERLVNDRGEPDFWNVSRTLEAYQRPVGNAQQTVKQEVAAVAPGKKELFTDPKVLAALL